MFHTHPTLVVQSEETCRRSAQTQRAQTVGTGAVFPFLFSSRRRHTPPLSIHGYSLASLYPPPHILPMDERTRDRRREKTGARAAASRKHTHSAFSLSSPPPPPPFLPEPRVCINTYYTYIYKHDIRSNFKRGKGKRYRKTQHTTNGEIYIYIYRGSMNFDRAKTVAPHSARVEE